MATIVDNPKYGEGHQVVLKEQSKMPSAVVVAKFKEKKYAFGSSVFTLLRKKPTPSTKVDDIDLGGTKVIYLKDQSNKVIKLAGTPSLINGSFNHYTENAKSNTTMLTELKETISMIMFENMVEKSKILTEEQLTKLLDREASKHYDTVYYTSALAQTKQLKKYIGVNRGYTYERQGKNKTAKLYEVARKLTHKLNDNWNPADVWMIKSGYDMNILYNAKTFKQLNSEIVKAVQSKDILPISLKQVTKGDAKLSLIDPAKMIKEKLDLDLTIDKVDLSESFNNFILWTKSGFGIRAGFKASATTLNVSLEGRFKGAGYQVGAVDARDFEAKVQEYEALASGPASTKDIEKSKRMLDIVWGDKKFKLSSKFKNLDEAHKAVDKGDKLTKDRFYNLMSYLYHFYADSAELIKFSYYSSKKISDMSSAYIIIQ